MPTDDELSTGTHNSLCNLSTHNSLHKQFSHNSLLQTWSLPEQSTGAYNQHIEAQDRKFQSEHELIKRINGKTTKQLPAVRAAHCRRVQHDGRLPAR